MVSEALVGRDREIDALEEGLGRLARGEGSLLLFSGEPGIGKTRMLEELALRAGRAGALIGWGRVWEVGMTPAFWPWVQALTALETPSERAPALNSLEERADAGARVARFGEVVAFLQQRSAQAPLAISDACARRSRSSMTASPSTRTSRPSSARRLRSRTALSS